MKHLILKWLSKRVILIGTLLMLVLQDAMAQYQIGDVFVAVSGGKVQRRSEAGVLLQTLNTGLGGFTTGMAFDASDNLYVTDFSANAVSKFNNLGVLQGTFGSGYSTPESIVFDATGNAYVGNLGNGIRKYDASGVFLGTSFAGRVDWIDLASDNCTMLRTTEGSFIGSHNVCTNTANANFASGLGGNAYALRIRDNGEILLANGSNIKRISAAGAVLQTYTVAGESSWFALNLSLDGTSFWSANISTANVYRIDIATGAVISSFNTGTGGSTVFGLAVFGEFQAALCAVNTPPAFISPTPACGSTIQGYAGVPMSFTVTASDADAADVVKLNVSGLPSGATMTPTLQASGNPVSSTFSWTPTSADAGTYSVTFKAADKCKEVSCTYTIDVQACVTTAVCKNASITLAGGTATVAAADVDGGSTATCGIASMTVTPNTFSCADIGDHAVVLTVTDVNGISSTCTASVTVVGEIPSCSIVSVPTNNVYTGGVPTNLYLGYGPQSTTLEVSAPASGAPYTYAWAAAAGLSNTNTANPVFTATVAGSFTFTVEVTNKYGCKAQCSITICVTDVRVPGTNGKKVYVCHVPEGNPGNAHTISISVNAVPSHVGLHGGDQLGKCGQTPCTAATSASMAADELGVIGNDESATAFKVTVSPNPTRYQFTIRLQSNVDAPVSIRILNSTGQVVESSSKINANSTVRFGGKLRSGAYMAEIVQGNIKKMIRLEKIN